MIGAPMVFNAGEAKGPTFVYGLTEPSPDMPFLTQTKPFSGSSGFLGRTLAISGGRVVVGAQFTDAVGPDQGDAYVNDWDGPSASGPGSIHVDSFASAMPTLPVLMLTRLPSG